MQSFHKQVFTHTEIPVHKLRNTQEERFNQQQLINIFYAHPHLGKNPNDTFYNAWRNAALRYLNATDPKEQFNQQQLVIILHVHALLGRKLDKKFYKAWEKVILAHLDTTNPQERFNQQVLASIIYSHALLDQKLDKEFSEAWEKEALTHLNTTNPKEQFDQPQLHSIYLAMKRLNLEDLLKDSFPRASVIKVSKAEKPIKSRLQKDVCKSLKTYLETHKLQSSLKQEYWVDDVASRVDIYLELGSQKIIIEVDGPSHFFPGTRKYTPKNKLREEIINKSQKFTKFVRIPYYEWKKLDTVQFKNIYLANKLSLSVTPELEKDKVGIIELGIIDKLEKNETEIKSEKPIARASLFRADAPAFVPQFARKLPSRGEERVIL